MEKYPDSWQDAAQEFFNEYQSMVAPAVTDDPGTLAINKLSEALLEKGKMTGFDVAALLESIWPGELPPEALPAADHETGLNGESSPADGIQRAYVLCRMAYDILAEHGEACEKAAHAVLNAVFQLQEGQRVSTGLHGRQNKAARCSAV